MMTNKKKPADPSPIQQLIAYAASNKDNKCTLLLPVSETENIEIEVKRLLNADEMVSLVNGVTDALFLYDKYCPALYELVYAKAIIAYYTDLGNSISNDNLVSLVFDTSIIEKIESEINVIQREKMTAAICENISLKKQEISNSQSARLEEAIRQIELLTVSTSKFAEQFDGIDLKQIAESSIKLANISERNLVNNILEIRFDEEASAKNVEADDEHV